jgi:regulator of sigma E protease
VDLTTVLADFGGFIWTIGSFLIALGVIVSVHEYGHYIIGRLSGIGAEVFSLGFGPVLASRVDARGTRWQLAAIPLGGFVKFKGDRDAASAQPGDVTGLTAAEARATMAGAPLWARTATVAAGPIFNFILAFVIFAGIIMASGLPQEKPVVGTLYAMPTAQGLQPGDTILAVAGVPTPDWKTYAAAAAKLPPAAQVAYDVLRADQALQVMAAHPSPARVGAVHPKNAAMRAGILEGDVVIQADGVDVTAFAQLPPIVAALNGAPVALRLWRAGAEIDVVLTPNRRDVPNAEGGFDTRWLVGLSSGALFAPEMRAAGPWETARLAAKQVYTVLAGSLSGMAHLVRGDISSCNVSGPVGLAGAMGDAARSGLDSFLSMLAVVSLGVGMLNLFPIPVLDGGHLMFFAYEAITRRKPNARVLNIAVAFGMALVLALTVFALGNDLTCS